MKKKLPKTKKEIKVERIYLVNPTLSDIEVGGYIFEPDDPKSIPVELEKEARGKGLV